MTTVSFDKLKAFIHAAMVKLGLPDADAAVVAALMAQADLQGSDGHGISRLPQYARRIRAGGFNVKPNIRVVREQASTALLNGDNGMGHLVMSRAAGIAIDREGKPLTDPKRAEEGMLLPLGGMEAGYKGYGLAMIIGLLAGTLGGAAMGKDVIDFNHDDDSVTNTGQAICAINVAAFGEVATFKAAVDTLARDIRGSQRMPGVERITMPGERSEATRVARGRDGIPLAPALQRSLDELARELSIAPLQ